MTLIQVAPGPPAAVGEAVLWAQPAPPGCEPRKQLRPCTWGRSAAGSLPPPGNFSTPRGGTAFPASCGLSTPPAPPPSHTLRAPRSASSGLLGACDGRWWDSLPTGGWKPEVSGKHSAARGEREGRRRVEGEGAGACGHPPGKARAFRALRPAPQAPAPSRPPPRWPPLLPRLIFPLWALPCSPLSRLLLVVTCRGPGPAGRCGPPVRTLWAGQGFPEAPLDAEDPRSLCKGLVAETTDPAENCPPRSGGSRARWALFPRGRVRRRRWA